MSSTNAEEQAAAVQPPRTSQIISLAVDATSRSYSIASLALGGVTPEEDTMRRLETWITLQADGGDVFYTVSASAATVDDTAKIAVGNALAYAATYCAKIKQDDRHEFRLDRARDLFINVKTSAGTATLRFWASSNPGA